MGRAIFLGQDEYMNGLWDVGVGVDLDGEI